LSRFILKFKGTTAEEEHKTSFSIFTTIELAIFWRDCHITKSCGVTDPAEQDPAGYQTPQN
jgi:hypothetical protein